MVTRDDWDPDPDLRKMTEARFKDALRYYCHMVNRRNYELKEHKTGPTREKQFKADLDEYFAIIAAICSVSERMETIPSGRYLAQQFISEDYWTSTQMRDHSRLTGRFMKQRTWPLNLTQAHPEWFNQVYTPAFDEYKQWWSDAARTLHDAAVQREKEENLDAHQ